MFLAKFVSKEFVDYVFINKNNELTGFSLDKNGMGLLHNDIVNQFINCVCINDGCIEMLDDINGYNVYYDQKTKFKHYIKDGKEDFLMFLKNNGVLALMYEMTPEQENVEGNKKLSAKDCFKIIVGFAAVNVVVYCSSFGIATILSKYGYDTLKDYGYYRYIAEEVDVFNEDGILDYYAFLDDSNNYDGSITAQEALQFINASPNLISGDKEILANESFLNDILPYYDGTTMAQDIKLRLDGLKLGKSYEKPDIVGNLIAGYYNPLEPSTIYVDENFYESTNNTNSLDDYTYDVTRKGILAHEFIHLFQVGDDYKYLTETSAELMAEEYFDTKLNTNYEVGVTSLKLLIDIIGPEPVLKGIFRGDFSDLNNILANNLNLNDYTKLMEYFKYSPDKIVDKDSDIRQIFCNLYQNCYGQNIHDDKNILYDFVYGNYKDAVVNQIQGRRYYLNKSKMNTKDVFSINSAKLMLLEPENDYIEDSIVYFYAKDVIDYQTWLNNYKGTENEQQLTYYTEVKHVERVPDGQNYYVYSIGQMDSDTGKIIKWNDNPTIISLDEALSRGYVSAGIEFVTEKAELAEGQEWCYDENGQIRTLCTYRSKVDDNIYYQYNDVFITVPGIKERFNVEMYANGRELHSKLSNVNDASNTENFKSVK